MDDSRGRERLATEPGHVQVTLQVLQAVSEGMGDGLVVADLDHRFIIFNEAARRLLGVGPTSPSPETWAENYGLFRPDTKTLLPTSELPLIRAMRGERATLEVYVRNEHHPEGLWASCTLSPLTDERGTITGGITVFRDITEARREKMELVENRRRLDYAQRVGRVGCWEWDLLRDVVSWTDEHYRLFGLDPRSEKASYEMFMRRIHVDDQERVSACIRRALNEHRTFDVEYRAVLPDGSLRYFSGQGDVLCDETGTPVWMIGVTHDVTPMKLTEMQLRDSQSKLRAIIEHTSDIIYIKNRAGHYIFANQAAADLFGFPLDELPGRPPEEVFDAATLRRIRTEDELVMRTGCPHEFEQKVVLHTGQSGCFLTLKYPYYDDGPEPFGIIGVARNITARKQAEEAIRRSNALLQAQQEAALEGILAVDEHGKLIGYNQRFVQMWQIPPDAMEGKTDRDLIRFVLPQLVDPVEFVAQIDRLNAAPFETSRNVIRMKDGRILDRYTAPVVSPGRDYYGRVWSFRDITEQKRLEERLQEQFQKLQQLDRIKSNFVNAVTHELRTPLTSIMGYAEFLEDGIGGALSNEQLEFVHQLENGAKRLDSLLGDLLDFARIEAGTFKVSPQEADLNQKVREIVRSLQPQAREAQLAITMDLPPDPNTVPMDSQRIGQVLLNLLGNAIKFTPSGGSIRVRAIREADHVVCEVRDTGAGIAPADIPKLFNRFTQLEAGVRKGVGVGLGLSISKSIISAHGGEVGVRSEPGKGSTFWFSLPLTPLNTPAGPQAP